MPCYALLLLNDLYMVVQVSYIMATVNEPTRQ